MMFDIYVKQSQRRTVSVFFAIIYSICCCFQATIFLTAFDHLRDDYQIPVSLKVSQMGHKILVGKEKGKESYTSLNKYLFLKV